MSKIRVVNIGYLLSDWLISFEHFPTNPRDHQVLSELKIEPGGASNFLIAGQRLGAEMAVLDTLGADTYGLALLTTLEREGVDISGVEKVTGARSRAVVAMSNSSGKHLYLPFQGSTMPEQEFSVTWKEVLSNADAVYIDGFALRQDYIRSAALEAAKWMCEQGKKVFFDPGPGADEAAKSILLWTYGIFLTADELENWTKGGVLELFTASETIELVVVKHGAQGCTVHHRSMTPLSCPGFEVPVREAMGAGDVFNAAFLMAYLRGDQLSDCGGFANAAGAVKVQKFGAGRNVPTLDEVTKLLKSAQKKYTK